MLALLVWRLLSMRALSKSAITPFSFVAYMKSQPYGCFIPNVALSTWSQNNQPSLLQTAHSPNRKTQSILAAVQRSKRTYKPLFHLSLPTFLSLHLTSLLLQPSIHIFKIVNHCKPPITSIDIKMLMQISTLTLVAAAFGAVAVAAPVENSVSLAHVQP